jgi:branched-chain amino acid transport system ATP-binding protein
VKLVVSNLEAGYGPVAVLHGVSIELSDGEILAVVGANGAGKSTFLRCVSGLLRPRAGTIELDGESLGGRAPHRLAREGIALVPEGRHLFAELTVQENLRMGLNGVAAANSKDGRRRLGLAYELFPVLHDFASRRAGALSGGQQQMLAIARALVREPRLLLLDEPSLGLAPQMIAGIFGTLRRLRAAGTGVLLVEQNAAAALGIADAGCVMESGRLSARRPAPEMLDDPEVGRQYLGAAAERGQAATMRRLTEVIGYPLV